MTAPKTPLAKKREKMQKKRAERSQKRREEKLAAKRTSKGYRKFGAGASA